MRSRNSLNDHSSGFLKDLRRRGIHAENVLDAMIRVPREQFVLEQDAHLAYGDYPLPIGYGQTISQPYMVAVMTQMLQLECDHRVLEIGTGCGYQTAILAELAEQVYSVERLASLCEQARYRLTRLGYDHVHLRCDDGYLGWPEYAPYDGIIVTCAPDHIPKILVAQLAEGGRMVIPVGPAGQQQVLWLLEQEQSRIKQSKIMRVAFVPLISSQSREDT